MEAASVNLAALGVDPDRIPVVTRDQVKYARPDPDLFLAAAERLNAPIETAVVVGDSIWDMLNSLQLSLNIFSIVPERRRRNPRTKTLVCPSCRKIEKHQCG